MLKGCPFGLVFYGRISISSNMSAARRVGRANCSGMTESDEDVFRKHFTPVLTGLGSGGILSLVGSGMILGHQLILETR
jgi:hypothetical protein